MNPESHFHPREVIMKKIFVSTLILAMFVLSHVAISQTLQITPKSTDALAFCVDSSHPLMSVSFTANELNDESDSVPRPVPSTSLRVELRDYRDQLPVESPTITLTQSDENIVATFDTTTLSPGYYELVIRHPDFPPENSSRIGCVILSPKMNHPYLCIDGAISWLTSDPTLRKEMIQLAKKSGISMIRERISPRDIFPTEDSYHNDRPEWNGGVRKSAKYDTLREMFALYKMPILDMGHDTPDWTGKVGAYPSDLNASSQMWGKIAKRWNANWGGFELWNEPDIMFSGNMPADQYAAWCKAVSVNFPHEIRPIQSQKTITTPSHTVPLIGGVNALYNPDWMETAASNGLLDQVDIWSFHTYATALQMEEITKKYRDWLTKWGHSTMPLWLTECGRPWKKGPDRAPLSEDQNSALDIAMKAIEAYASGVERYFAFVLPYYEENDNNFGMLSRDGAPQRSFAAYVTVGAMLQNSERPLPYFGDLNITQTPSDQAIPILRARVFRTPISSDSAIDKNEQKNAHYLFVFYTGKNRDDAVIDPGKLSEILQKIQNSKSENTNIKLCCFGIDGRPLPLSENGQIPIPDGMTYLQIDLPSDTPWSQSLDSLIVQTETLHLWNISTLSLQSDTNSRPVFSVPSTSQFVLRYDFDDTVSATPIGYQIQEESLQTLPIQTTLFWIQNDQNSIEESRSVKLKISVQNSPVESDWIEGDAIQNITISKGKTATANWRLNIPKTFGSESERWIRVEMVDGHPDEFVVFRILRRKTLENILEKSEKSEPLPIEQMDRWNCLTNGMDGKIEPFQSVIGTTYMDTQSSQHRTGVKITANFPTPGDHWCYPQFMLPDPIHLEDYNGIALRVRTDTPGDVRIFLWETGDVGWISHGIYDPNGRIQTIFIRFSDLVISQANTPDPNGRLDLEKVRRIAIGMNPKSEKMSLEILDAVLCRIPE